MIILYKGLHDLNDDEKHLFEQLTTQTCERFENKWSKVLKPEIEISVHIKKHSPEGRRIRYSVHAHLPLPKASLSVHNDDWDMHILFRELFQKLNNEAEKYFKEYHARK